MHGPRRGISPRGAGLTALEEVKKRLVSLSVAIDDVGAMRTKQQAYMQRIERLEQRITKTVGRSFRGGARWLRRWKNLWVPSLN